MPLEKSRHSLKNIMAVQDCTRLGITKGSIHDYRLISLGKLISRKYRLPTSKEMIRRQIKLGQRSWRQTNGNALIHIS
jgi:hypothetical protein